MSENIRCRSRSIYRKVVLAFVVAVALFAASVVPGASSAEATPTWNTGIAVYDSPSGYSAQSCGAWTCWMR